MDEQLKKLLRDLQEREKTRKEELEKFDFQKTEFDSQIRKLAAAMKKDILDGLYKSTPEDKLKQLIKDEKNKIRKKYNNENNELGNESRKKMEVRHFQEKETDYKQISSAIKDYHLDMVLELNKARIYLALLEEERKAKLQELDKKLAQKEAERNAKIQGIDKKIAEKQAEKVYEMVLNSDLDIETNTKIKILGEEIERLKVQKEFISDEEIDQIKIQKEAINNEYASKIEVQNKQLQYYSQQKDRAGKLIGQIRLSEKSINQIYEILFGEEKENRTTKNEEEEVEEQVNTELAKNEEEEVEEQVNTELAENEEEEVEEQVNTELAGNEEGENENTQNNKFSYRFSIRGIYFDGKYIGIKEMLEWYTQNKRQIENQIKSVLMDEEEKIEDFLQNSDKLIYISMAFKSSNAPSYGAHLNDKAIEQLKEYYSIWANPQKEESNMDIKCDLRGISMLWMSRKISYREVQNIWDNAFKLKDRKNVTLDKVTEIRFSIRKWMEKIKEERQLKKADKRKDQISDEKKYDPKEIAKEIGQNVKSWILTPEAKLKANKRIQSNNEQTKQKGQEITGEEQEY